MNITIVGGGFGGVKAALELSSDPDTKITLITNSPNFQYYPSLYSAATGHDHRESWVPLLQVFASRPNVTLILDTITQIRPDHKKILGKSGETYSYNTLILALGSVTTYFGIEGLDHYAFGIKSEQEIRKLQRHLFEEMGNHKIIDKHYVVIGAGPTGVELSASLGQYLERLRKYFGLPKQKIHVDLIEGAPRVLPRMSEATSRAVTRRLMKLGVNVECGKMVQSATADSLLVSGKPIQTHTIIWTSGVANAPFFKDNAEYFTLDQRQHVIVDEYMQARKNIYVLGDNAATPYAGLAQTALHDAVFVARNILRHKNHQKLKKYKAVHPPSVIPVGKNWSAFEWGRLHFSGSSAAFIRDAADIIGYHDILPLGQAIDTWRSGMKAELRLPDDITSIPR